MLIPIRVDRTTKPPMGTPLRSDGHWSVQGLVSAWAFNEGAGKVAFNNINGTALINSTDGCFINTMGLSIGNANGTPINLQLPTSISKFTLVTKFTPKGSLTVDKYFFDDSNFSVQVGTGGVFLIRSRLINETSCLSEKSTTLAFSFPSEGYSDYFTVFQDGKKCSENVRCYTTTINLSSLVCGGYWGSQQNCITENIHLYNIILSALQVASISANPWQIYEPETVWIEVGGGGSASLFGGTLSGQSSVSAQLSTAIAIAAQVAAAGNLTGGINTAIRLSTTAQGSGSAAALLTTAIRMAAATAGTGATSADINTAIRLAAAILAQGSAGGALATSIRFEGAIPGSATITAALTSAIVFAAQSAGLGLITGQLSGTIAAALFAGTLSGSAATIGNLTSSIRFGGGVQGTASAAGNLTTALILAAATNGDATAQAALSTALELAAHVTGLGSAGADLSYGIAGLSGAVSGTSAAISTLATAIQLLGLAAGQCNVSGRLATPGEVLARITHLSIATKTGTCLISTKTGTITIN